MELKFSFLKFGSKIISSKFAYVLIPFSWIWALVIQCRNALYTHHWLHIHRVSVPVVSVGNLTSGGSGKTPLVILLGKTFAHLPVAIIARGFGSKKGELNDEMQLIQKHLPESKLYQGKDRVALAQQAEKEGAKLIILDDGFQHRRLYRDFDLLILRREDFKDRLLPSGFLREPFIEKKRAHFLFSYEEVPVQTTRLQLKPVQPPSLQGQRVAIFCGIGHPERFRKTVESLGAQIVLEQFLADHEPMVHLENFILSAKQKGARAVLCTEKDAMKVSHPDLISIQVEATLQRPSKDWEILIAQIQKKVNDISLLKREAP